MARAAPAAYVSLLVNYEAEHVAGAEQEALRHYKRPAEAAIAARLKVKLAEAAHLFDAPKAIRLRAFARAQAETEYRIACELFDATVAELLDDGEVSGDLDHKWTALINPEHADQLWPADTREVA